MLVNFGDFSHVPNMGSHGKPLGNLSYSSAIVKLFTKWIGMKETQFYTLLIKSDFVPRELPK